MPDTKAKILDVAGRLFYHEGIANIRLQQIADAVGISVGNLAYHFKNKEAIVAAVYEDLFKELADILSRYVIYPQFSGFDKQFSAMYSFYEKNSFTFNNSWEIERNFPEIQKDWLHLNNKILIQLKKRIDFNIENGLIKKEPYKGAYDLLAQTLLLTINCWIPQQTLRGKPVKEDLYKRNLWAIIYPNFTEKGTREYEISIAPIIY
jgi:AcrR family transcriptional regulator